MLVEKKGLHIVEPEPEDIMPPFRLVRNRTLHLEGILNSVSPFVGSRTYHKMGELALAGKKVRHKIFTLLTWTTKQNHEQLMVVDRDALEALYQGITPTKLVEHGEVGFCDTTRPEQLALTGEAHFTYYRPEQGLRIPVDFSIDGKGGVYVTDASKRGTWVAADWENVRVPLLNRSGPLAG